MSYKSANGTGTGEIGMVINAADGLPLNGNQFNEAEEAGTYNVEWDGTAAMDPDCDPTQGPCEMWIAGNYSVDVGKLWVR